MPDSIPSLSDAISQITSQLNEVMQRSQQVQEDLSTRTEQATSDGREVSVELDGRGVLRRIEFAPAFADLDPDELRQTVLDTVAAARAGLQGPRPARDPVEALHDDSLSRALLQSLQGGSSAEGNPV